MNQIYCSELEKKVNRKLWLYLLVTAVVLITGILLEVLMAAVWAVTVPVAVGLGLMTAVLGIGICWWVQTCYLPLYHADRLMKQLVKGETEPFEGVFRGLAEAKTMQSGVMMYKLRLDEGKKVGKEPVFRELNIPAVFGKPQIEEGTVLRGESAEGIIVRSELPSTRKVNPPEGKYQVSMVAVLVLVAASALLWCGIYGAAHKQTAEAALNVAVCTPAHHEETETEVKQAMALDETEVVFSYTNTLDAESVAMYLATFGAMDADILVLNGDQFAGVFENEGYPLETEDLTAALGFEPRFAVNAEGQATGVVLYIPGDPEYNAHFPKLIDWIAVEKDVALVAAIRHGSVHAPSGQAILALVQLLTYLANK